MEPNNTFTFALGQRVHVTESGEAGVIIARVEYQRSESSYLLRYRAADGCAVEAWWRESALQAVGA